MQSQRCIIVAALFLTPVMVEGVWSLPRPGGFTFRK